MGKDLKPMRCTVACQPTLLIITGPQGSGCHLWSRLFAAHPAVYGWKDLLDKHWIGHKDEPFASCWKTPDLLENFDWNSHSFYTTSISCPYAIGGKHFIPDYVKFISNAKKYCDVKLAFLGRDKNILKEQQVRVRKKHTTNLFFENTKDLMPDYFLSMELLHLYKEKYLLKVMRDLNFPVRMNYHDLYKDENKKYIKHVKEFWLDKHVWDVSGYTN